MRTCTRRAAVAFAATMAALLVPGVAVAVPPGPAAGDVAFGRDFLWGVAASGFQSEGYAPDSNWRRYAETHALGAEDYGNSVDFFHQYASDIELARQLGVKVFRIGIEWARLQPNNRLEWDAKGFEFYEKVIGTIVAAGMTPMLTLDHWVYPGWACKRTDVVGVPCPDGWNHPDMVNDWMANMEKVVTRFAYRKPLWVTINEPVAYIMHEVRHNGTDQALMEDRIAEAHNRIYDFIHRVQPDAKVTSNMGYVAGEDDKANGGVIEKIRDKLDYIGLDYYFGYEPPKTQPIATVRSIAAVGDPGMWNLPLRTEGIYYALHRYWNLFGKNKDKPIYIVENGMPTADGDDGAQSKDCASHEGRYTRSCHLLDTLYWIKRAKADGIRIVGYNYWSITDNYEWGSYSPRFGLYTVDVLKDPTLTRRPTDAVATYQAVIGASDLPAGYRPRPPAPCELVDPPASCDRPVS
ncbi:family 1 glycosylhydrolase [Nocardia sp. NPDC049149]|uniref:family 1 glycosylhydrolase n=1 Tax=Nocardia sp. NPDC049149 TaxID=3364315 RepID=UPI00371E59D5